MTPRVGALRRSVFAKHGGLGALEHILHVMRLRVPLRLAAPRLGRGWLNQMKTVFTTGEAAKICKVSQQTIIRCFDSGQLKGFRVPGSRFRRIPRAELYSFMRDNGIPTDALESGKRKILVVDDDQELVDLIVDVLEKDGRFEVRSVNNGFDAGMMVKEYHPDLIVLDVMLPDINGREVCTRVRGDKTMDDVKIICISGMIENDKIEDLKAVRRKRFLAQAVRGGNIGRSDRRCWMWNRWRRAERFLVGYKLPLDSPSPGVATPGLFYWRATMKSRTMLSLPRIVHGAGRWTLPLCDATALALAGALVDESNSARVDKLVGAIVADPALAVWSVDRFAVGEPSGGTTSTRSLAEWLAPRLIDVLRWPDCSPVTFTARAARAIRGASGRIGRRRQRGGPCAWRQRCDGASGSSGSVDFPVARMVRGLRYRRWRIGPS